MTKQTTYDLEERTALFSEKIITLCKTLEKNITITPLISQLIRSATSIGANYSEANGASSKKDFANKIYLCKKEARETLYWLRLIKKSTVKTDLVVECQRLWNEVYELVLIFSKIAKSSK